MTGFELQHPMPDGVTMGVTGPLIKSPHPMANQNHNAICFGFVACPI